MVFGMCVKLLSWQPLLHAQPFLRHTGHALQVVAPAEPAVPRQPEEPAAIRQLNVPAPLRQHLDTPTVAHPEEHGGTPAQPAHALQDPSAARAATDGAAGSVDSKDLLR